MESPRGTLISIGGGEDKESEMNILHEFIKETGRKDPRIGVITTASGVADEVWRDYRNAFEILGIKNSYQIHIDTKEESNDDKFVNMIEDADGILFSGGDQLKLTTVLGGSRVLDVIRDKYQNERFVIAGTSAGAAAMSRVMIVKGNAADSLTRGELQMGPGFGFIEGAIIDTHFMQRGRFGRLIHGVTINPSEVGIGLSEDTGIIILDGNRLEIIGSGLVVIICGKDIKNTDLTEVLDGEPFSVEGLRLDVLSKGHFYDMKERIIRRR